MTFKELFEYSQRIRSESSRNGKIEIISEYLAKLTADEVPFGVHYIAGRLPQGRMNLAWKGLSDLLHATFRETTQLPLAVLHGALEQVKKAHGQEKYKTLQPIFAKLNKEQREYLLSLIFGEAQQGAGEGVVKKAIAHAFSLSDSEIEEAYEFQSGQAQDLASLLLLFRCIFESALRQDKYFGKQYPAKLISFPYLPHF